MATKLERIAELSAQNPNMVFTSIGHLIDVKLLRECHEKMDGDKSIGIDGVTKEEYGWHLNENLVDLVDRLKKKSYKPKPARRVEIPKDNGKTSRKKSIKKLKEIHRKIREMRTLPTKAIVKKLNEILVGYFHYYGVTDNSRCIKAFRYEVMKSLFYWLNRRGQKKSYNWVNFLNVLDTCHPLAEARIYVSIYAQ